MSVTVHLDENQSARVTDQLVETRPPDRIELVAEGIVTVTEELMGDFEGAALQPSQVVISVDESHVTVDLTEEAALRLDEIDVGVETPDASDISPDLESLDPTSSESSAVSPGAIAFTVEGAILNVPEEAFEPLSDCSPTLEAVTFAVDDATRSDGGSNDDGLVELSLLGYGIVIYRDGVIEVGTHGGVTDVGPL